MYAYLKNDAIPDRIKSYYQSKYESKALHEEEATNGFLANPFIPIEIKNIEQKKKIKGKLLENYLKNML